MRGRKFISRRSLWVMRTLDNSGSSTESGRKSPHSKTRIWNRPLVQVFVFFIRVSWSHEDDTLLSFERKRSEKFAGLSRNPVMVFSLVCITIVSSSFCETLRSWVGVQTPPRLFLLPRSFSIHRVCLFWDDWIWIEFYETTTPPNRLLPGNLNLSLPISITCHVRRK